VGTRDKRVEFETARLALSRLHLDRDQRDLAIRHAIRVSAGALHCDRAGVWLFRGDTLVAEVLWDVRTGQYGAGDTVFRSRSPRYWDALSQRRVVVADDALNNPVTQELRASYLEPLGIGAMIDAPLYRDGELVGVVCHEAVGGPRTWQQRDIDFATNVSDLISALRAQREVAELEQALRLRVSRQRELDKLEALTRLSRSIAHDFNNVLTAVQLAASRLELPSTDRRELVTVLRASAELGQFLAHQLSTFATRDGDDARANGNRAEVRRVLDDLAPMLALLMRDSASLELDHQIVSARTALPAGELEQIILNLVLNARDASPAGATVTVRTRAARADELPSGLAIDVIDHGTGIGPDQLPRIFEPGFTTKRTGTGLGLATVRDIVHEHDGQVRVSSELGRGSVFTVLVPAEIPAPPR
jgi:two-component system cell cycle sensor histidine kinase/response regulator CckA